MTGCDPGSILTCGAMMQPFPLLLSTSFLCLFPVLSINPLKGQTHIYIYIYICIQCS